MEIKKRIEKLYKTLNDTELPDKAELKRETGYCINSLIDYYHTVVSEQLYYSDTAADERNSYIMKQKDEQRSEKHDDCIRSCARLNEICQAAGVEPVCDFDISDRRKVAEFCGFIVSSLFFSNINCEDPLASCLSFADADRSDTEIFINVLKDLVIEKLNSRFEDIKFVCHKVYVEGYYLYFDYEDSFGYRETVGMNVDTGSLYLHGYVNRIVDRFYWDIVSCYLTREDEAEDDLERRIGTSPDKEKFEKLIKLFNAEFRHWCDHQFELYDGDAGRVSQDIGQLMNAAFCTDVGKLTDLVTPFDINVIQENIAGLSSPYHYTYEQAEPGRNSWGLAKNKWMLTSEDESRTLSISLMEGGYLLLRAGKQDMFAYNLDTLEHGIYIWSVNRFP